MIQRMLSENVVTREMIREIESWPEPLTANQPPPFARNMRGRTLSPKNYLTKLFLDYFTDNDLFESAYTPHPDRPTVNYFLRKKFVQKPGEGYFYTEAVDVEDFDYFEFLQLLIFAYSVMGCDREFSIKIYAPPMLSIFAAAFFSARLLSLPPPKLGEMFTILFSPRSLETLRVIMVDPLGAGVCSETAESAITYYCKHVVPRCVLSDVYFSGLHRIGFKN